tara:strand:- start:409 stop:1590 length:1182 start_codon:yes stop_codon:yes gene_type:complete
MLKMNQLTQIQKDLEKDVLSGLLANIKGYKSATLEDYAKKIVQNISIENMIPTSQISLPEVGKLEDTKFEQGVDNLSTDSSIHGNTDPASYVRKITAHYTEVKDEFMLFDAHFDSTEPLLLEGPKGCGKSLAVAKWCSMREIPFITFDCSEGVKEGHLIGRLIIQGKSTPFHLGLLPTIIEICNKHGGAVIIFEELNSLTAQMQKLLNPLLDWRKGVFVEAVGVHYEVKEGNKLLVMATMNPSSYGGVNELNDDLLSRFTVDIWDYPTMSEEKKILAHNIKEFGVPAEIVKQFMKLAQETRAAEKRESESISHSISTRELDSIFRLYKAYSKKWDNPVTKLINGKIRGMYHEEEEWNIVKSRVESIFGREVFNEAFAKMDEDEIEEKVEEDIQ